MFFRHSYDKLIYPIIVLIILTAVSYRPKYHLRGDMPPEFSRSSGKSQVGGDRPVDQRIAWAFWESAQMDIQWRYAHGQTLPPDPPPEFHVDAKALGPAATDPSTRQMYWKRLQQVWYVPETWQRQYEWDFTWASDPLSSGAAWLREKADKILR